MTTLVNRLALAALLALPMAGGGIPLPAMADDPVEFVCYDREIGGGKTEIVCEPADVVAAECEKSDPDSESAECAAVDELHRGAPSGFTDANEDSGTNNDGHRGSAGRLRN